MRKLLDADEPKGAKQIVDLLLVEGIESEVRPDGGLEIWVIDEQQMEAARAVVARTEDGPPDVARRAKEIRRARELDKENHAQRHVDVSTRWGGLPGLSAGPVTIFLLVGSLVIALMKFVNDYDVDPMWTLTIDHWSSTEPLQRVRAGEVWRLVTPMFLHFGLFHLAFNMLWLNTLGRQVEAGHGSVVMVALVVVAEVAGNLGQYFVSGPAFGGMSGVVYALFGFVWMNARYNRRYRYEMSDVNTVIMMGWFVGCATGLFGPIANIGHAGGLVVGLLFGLPSYLRHIRATSIPSDFAEGSWADVNATGFRRFRRRWLAPYAPLWFLGLAALVITVEHLDKYVDAEMTGVKACDDYLEALDPCLRPQGVTRGQMVRSWRETGMLDDPEAAAMVCEAGLATIDGLLAEAGCQPQ